jgi:hypothetical protein
VVEEAEGALLKALSECPLEHTTFVLVVVLDPD